jgi:hypothetical protein
MVLVLMLNMTLRKSVSSKEGRVTQLLAKEREGKYRMDPASMQPIETLERKGNQTRAFTSEIGRRQSEVFQKRRHVETA